MAMEKKSDILQVMILTLFMVSVFLLLLNFWFAAQREDAYAKVQKAVADYEKLRRDLKLPKLRNALAIEREYKESKDRQRLHPEINRRLARELPGVEPSPMLRPSYDRSGRYLIHKYKLASGSGRNKALKPFHVWLGFLARVEADRPDIHVEDVRLQAQTFELPEGGDKRDWSCDANLVLWQPREEET
jgi:hypothetical protein